jgi:hypothetical protein
MQEEAIDKLISERALHFAAADAARMELPGPCGFSMTALMPAAQT